MTAYMTIFVLYIVKNKRNIHFKSLKSKRQILRREDTKITLQVAVTNIFLKLTLNHFVIVS